MCFCDVFNFCKHRQIFTDEDQMMISLHSIGNTDNNSDHEQFNEQVVANEFKSMQIDIEDIDSEQQRVYDYVCRIYVGILDSGKFSSSGHFDYVSLSQFLYEVLLKVHVKNMDLPSNQQSHTYNISYILFNKFNNSHSRELFVNEVISMLSG